MARIIHFFEEGFPLAGLAEEMAQVSAMEKLNDIRHAFQGRRTVSGTEIDCLSRCLDGKEHEAFPAFADDGAWRGYFRHAVMTALILHSPLLKRRARRKAGKRFAAIAKEAREGRLDHVPESDRKDMTAFLSTCMTFCAADRPWFGCAIDGLFRARKESGAFPWK